MKITILISSLGVATAAAAVWLMLRGEPQAGALNEAAGRRNEALNLNLESINKY